MTAVPQPSRSWRRTISPAYFPIELEELAVDREGRPGLGLEDAGLDLLQELGVALVEGKAGVHHLSGGPAVRLLRSRLASHSADLSTAL